MAPPVHVPVLLTETMELLVTDPAGRYVDCTVGAGGHAEALFERLSAQGRILALDADPEALGVAGRRLENYGMRLSLLRANFRDAGTVLSERGFSPVTGVLMDLGISSYQLEKGARGLSFSADSPLDMRIDPTGTLTASEIVNRWTEDELETIFRMCGERRSRRIARAIVEARREMPLRTAKDLSDLVARHGTWGRLHPATRAFLALRITVNRELENLEAGLEGLKGHLIPGGRLAVISFHSLEDRIVKHAFRRWAKEGGWRLLTKKPLSPSREETLQNPRSRSAKLRAIEKL